MRHKFSHKNIKPALVNVTFSGCVPQKKFHATQTQTQQHQQIHWTRCLIKNIRLKNQQQFMLTNQDISDSQVEKPA